MTKFEPPQRDLKQSDLKLSQRNTGLVRDTPYIYSYFICKRKITILSYILKFQSGHYQHLLYLYNKKWQSLNPTVTLTLVVGTRVLFATHHTSMDISYMKEKLKSVHAYWSFRADTTTTVYMYKAGRTDRQTDGSILICHPSGAYKYFKETHIKDKRLPLFSLNLSLYILWTSVLVHFSFEDRIIAFFWNNRHFAHVLGCSG
jgi:hypothetical protein